MFINRICLKEDYFKGLENISLELDLFSSLLTRPILSDSPLMFSPSFGVEVLSLVTDSKRKIFCSLSDTKPNMSIPKPGSLTLCQRVRKPWRSEWPSTCESTICKRRAKIERAEGSEGLKMLWFRCFLEPDPTRIGITIFWKKNLKIRLQSPFQAQNRNISRRDH